jgi:hypothetical protein
MSFSKADETASGTACYNRRAKWRGDWGCARRRACGQRAQRGIGTDDKTRLRMAALLTLAGGIAGLAVAAIACFGWGWMVRRVAGLAAGRAAVTATLGLAALIFCGGVLNRAHLAYPLALDLLVLAGIAIAAIVAWRNGGRRSLSVLWPGNPTQHGFRLIAYAVFAIILGDTLIFEIAPRVYNPADDFQKYFAHVVRMIETGTLAGSPLNALGSETFGAQAFLQAFVVAHFPIYLINAVDAIFCFGLCLALASSVAAGRPAAAPGAILGMLLLFFIDPQYVNVSSLYSTAALIMAFVLLYADPAEAAPVATPGWRRAIAPGLLIAAVIALKPTGLLFFAMFFSISLPLLVYGGLGWRARLIEGIASALWALILVAPWVLLYLPEYLSGLRTPAPPLIIPVPAVDEPVDLLSSGFFGYYGPLLMYTVLAALLCAYAVLLLAPATRRDRPEIRRAKLDFAAAILTAVFAYFLWLLVGVHFVEAYSAMRYAMPIIIAVAPLTAGMGAAFWDEPTRRRGARRGTLLALLCTATVVALFGEPTLRRIDLLRHEGSALTFLITQPDAWKNDLQTLADVTLHGDAAAQVAQFQNVYPSPLGSRRHSCSTTGAIRSSTSTIRASRRTGRIFPMPATSCGSSAASASILVRAISAMSISSAGASAMSRRACSNTAMPSPI